MSQMAADFKTNNSGRFICEICLHPALTSGTVACSCEDAAINESRACNLWIKKTSVVFILG
jgi:hypothetical protein